MKTLLVVVAHPDDETFSLGGTIAKYAKAGWNVEFVAVTRGEAGRSGSFGELSQERLGLVRQGELEKAAIILGVPSVTFLDYIDGKLKKEPAGVLEERVYQEIAKNLPSVIITLEPGGISNHPDRRRLTIAVTFAFQKYAAILHDYYRAPENPPRGMTPDFLGRLIEREERIEPKLYYAGIPESIGAYVVQSKLFPAVSFGKPWSTISDKHITTVIDIRQFANKKQEALLAHETQREEVDRFLRIPDNPFMRQEHFVLRMQGIHEVFMGKNDQVSSHL